MRRSNPRTYMSRDKTGLGASQMETWKTQLALNLALLLSPSMTRMVVAVVAFEGHSESMKQVESLSWLLSSSVPQSLDIAISKDTLGEVLFEVASWYFTILTCIIVRLPSQKQSFPAWVYVYVIWLGMSFLIFLVVQCQTLGKILRESAVKCYPWDGLL